MDNKSIGTNIKNARKSKKLTQKELADMIEKAETTVRQYESGLIQVPVDVLQQISEALDMHLSYFFGWSLNEEDYDMQWRRMCKTIEEAGFHVNRKDDDVFHIYHDGDDGSDEPEIIGYVELTQKVNKVNADVEAQYSELDEIVSKMLTDIKTRKTALFGKLFLAELFGIVEKD